MKCISPETATPGPGDHPAEVTLPGKRTEPWRWRRWAPTGESSAGVCGAPSALDATSRLSFQGPGMVLEPRTEPELPSTSQSAAARSIISISGSPVKLSCPWL